MGEEFDVAIVGAGPAGCSAAITAAKGGLGAVVLEEHPAIGEPVHCGECLSQLSLDRMGIEPAKGALSLKVQGIRVIFPNKRSCLVNEKGWVLEKHTFEQWLAEEAQKEGAEVRTGNRVEDAKLAGGKWDVKLKEKSIGSKILIDASGVNSVISQKTGLNPKFSVVIGMQYEMQEIPNDGYIDFYIWPRLAPHGYLWMIPKCDGRANVGLVTSEFGKAKLYLDQFVKELGWEGKKVKKSFGGMIPASGPHAKTYSDGLMLVGDAAGMTSPLFEGGTQLGMKSGQFAAGVAIGAIGANDTSAGALSEYERLWRAEFPDYAKLLEGKSKLYSFNDEEINTIAGALPEDLSSMDVLDKASVGFKLMMSNGALVAKGAVSALMAFGYSRAKHYGW